MAEPTADDWFRILEEMELWWADCTEFVANEGQHKPSKVFGCRAGDICKWCWDHTNVDPTPLWDLTWFIDSHVAENHRYGFRPVPLPRIHRQVEHCLIHFQHLHNLAHSKCSTVSEGAKKNGPWIGGEPRRKCLADLARLLHSPDRNGLSDNQIGLKFTNGHKKKAQSMLTSLRRYIRLKRLQPWRES